MANILGGSGFGQGQGASILGGGQAGMPRVPWSQNPLVTTVGLSLLGQPTLQQGMQNVAANAPAGVMAKTGMQQQAFKQQQDEAEKKRTSDIWNQALIARSRGETPSPEVQAALYQIAPGVADKWWGPQEAPKPPTSVQEYLYGVENPDFVQHQMDIKKAGATTVDARQMGTIPPGYRANYDEQGRVISMEAIPGGPEDTSQNTAAAQEQQQRYGDVVLEDIRRAKDKVKNQSWYAPVSGAGGSLLSNVGGSAARDTAALIDTIKASIAFDRLQAMREASPTGGALGAVSERELGLLQASLGSLDQSQSDEQLLQNLTRLEEVYATVMEKASAYPNAAQFGFTSSRSAAPTAGVFEWTPDAGLRPAQ